MGKEFAETNITINALAPAVVRTAMVDAMPAEQVKYMTDKVGLSAAPFSRLCRSNLAVFLCFIVLRSESSFRNTHNVTLLIRCPADDCRFR